MYSFILSYAGTCDAVMCRRRRLPDFGIMITFAF